MDNILGKISDAVKEFLMQLIESNLTNMFTDVNDKVGTIAAEVGKTPSSWNGSIYSMVRGLSDNVIIPIAGIIITFVLCYELITMVTEKNNMHDMDTWMFFRWFFKAAVAVYLLTNTFNIVMAVFDIGQNVVSAAAGVIGGSTSIDICGQHPFGTLLRSGVHGHPVFLAVSDGESGKIHLQRTLKRRTKSSCARKAAVFIPQPQGISSHGQRLFQTAYYTVY